MSGFSENNARFNVVMHVTYLLNCIHVMVC